MPPKKKDAPPRKQKSGHQNRKRKRELILTELRAKADAIGCDVVERGSVAPGDLADGAEQFAVLQGPPLEDPNTALQWVRKAQLIAAHAAMTMPLTDALRERLKWVKDLSAVLGMTHPRSALEDEVKKLREAVAEVKARTGALKLEPGHAVSRPSTARGQRGRRGPRAVPGPGSGPAEGEDKGDPPVGGGPLGHA